MKSLEFLVILLQPLTFVPDLVEHVSKYGDYERISMTSVDINKIYSNDYADFFVEYIGIPSVLDQFRADGVQIINFFYAVAYLPISTMTPEVLSATGIVLPALFGLTNEASLEASGIIRLRNIPNFNLRGKGVLIGFVDTGIDYMNPVFQNADKTTRIDAIWDQTIISAVPQESIPYGTEYTRELINEALKSETPFQVVPSKDENGHGTMVAGISAGNEVPESGFYGVATDTDIVVIKLKPAKKYLKDFFLIPENADCYQENDLLFGIQYLLNYSYKVNKPLVICLSCDTPYYARDGRDIISGYLSIRSSFPGLAVIIPAGNERNARRHYLGVINESPGFDTIELNVGVEESGFTMRLWGASPNYFTIDITSPSGEYIPKIDAKLQETREVRFIFESTVIYISFQIVEKQTGDQSIFLRFIKPVAGIWKFKVYGRGIYPMNYNIWLPMNGFITPNTYFIRSTPDTTLLSVACASVPITVTAYNALDDSLFLDASIGYTRTNMVKPDIAAPGVNILSPNLDQSFSLVSGTSAAAAHTAGVAALLLEWGVVRGQYSNMSTQDIKVFMTRGARRRLDVLYPNKEWGYGILDVFNVFDSIRRGDT